MAKASVALGAPGCGPHGVEARARGRRPSPSIQATTCGPRERPETAAEPAAAPRSARSSARLRDEDEAGDAASFWTGGGK